MTALHREFGGSEKEGLRILAFPSNQFYQEPKGNDAIAKFAASKGVEFDMMQKTDINGAQSSLVFMWLKMSTGTFANDISWNFGTYWLVDQKGHAKRYDGVSPKDLTADIKDLLSK